MARFMNVIALVAIASNQETTAISTRAEARRNLLAQKARAATAMQSLDPDSSSEHIPWAEKQRQARERELQRRLRHEEAMYARKWCVEHFEEYFDAVNSYDPNTRAQRWQLIDEYQRLAGQIKSDNGYVSRSEEQFNLLERLPAKAKTLPWENRRFLETKGGYR